jgi:hypothetical protein
VSLEVETESNQLQALTKVFASSFVTTSVLAILADTPVTISLLVSLVIAVQVVTGARIWMWIRQNETLSLPELIGIGIAFGSFAAMLCSQVLRTTPLDRIAWLIPSAIVALLSVGSLSRSASHTVLLQRLTPLELTFILTAIPSALTYWWFWLWPLIAIPFLVYYVINRDTHRNLYWGALAIACSALLLAAQRLRNLNTFWWIWSHDQVFLEAMSTSVAKWGPAENIHSVGVGFKYHWFALAWSGMTSAASGAQPFVVSTKFLPIISMLGAVMLVWASVRSLTKSRSASMFAVVIFIFNDNLLNTSPVRLFHSPTYLFAVVWMLAFVFIFIKSLHGHVRYSPLLLAVMLFACFGGKVSHGAVTAAGFGLAALIGLIWRQSPAITRFLLQTSAMLTATVVAAYILLFRGQSIGSGNMLSLAFGRIGVEAGISSQDSSRAMIWLATITVVAALAPIFLIPSIVFARERWRTRADLHFAWGVGISGLILVACLAQDFGGQVYFVQSALAIAPIFAAVSIFEKISYSSTRVSSTAIMSMVCAGAIAAIIGFKTWFWSPANFDLHRAHLVITFTNAVGFLLIALIAPPLVSRFVKSPHPRIYSQVLRAILLVSLVISLGVIRRIDNFYSFSNHDQLSVTSPDLIQGSIDHVAALTWLRNNSDPEDIVATNRFCIPGLDYCNPKWTIVSALSRRRMLIEGYSYGQIRGSSIPQDPSLPPWAQGAAQPLESQNRLKFSIEFAEQPTKTSSYFLRSQNVSWVVVDHAAQQSGVSDWSPFGSVAYQNDAISVVLLTK